MASKREKCQNVAQRFMLRQIRGDNAHSPQFPRSRVLTKYLKRLCIPLRNIQQNNAFRSGHVLLGFSKSGEYLMSYCKRIQFGDHGYSFTYTLHWWRFNLTRPLHEVCQIPLFVGGTVTEELLLIVCHTLDKNRILVHGSSRAGHDDQSRQCYVTLSPSPPCPRCCKDSVNNGATVCGECWIAHMRYNLLPPFPSFIPFVQVKLRDTILVNTVDSLLAVTMNGYGKHEPSSGNKPQSQMSAQAETTGTDDDDPRKDCATTSSHPGYECPDKKADDCNPVLCREKNDECASFSATCQGCGENVCDDSDTFSIPTNNNNSCTEVVRDKALYNGEETATYHSKLTHISSFGFRIYCSSNQSGLEGLETTESSSRTLDYTSCLDINVTNVDNTCYRMVQYLHQMSSDINADDVPVHGSPCFHAKVVCLDVEKYINETLNTLNELRDMYWNLRNYNTQIVDVCDATKCVVVQVIGSIWVQPKAGNMMRRRRYSVSSLLSWNVSNGEVRVFDISSPEDTTNKCDREIFQEGNQRILSLRKKFSVPSGHTGIQAFSNHNVFTGAPLECIKHPFQPITIVL